MVAKSPAVQRKNASTAKRNITRTVSSVANTLGPKETMNVAGKFSGRLQPVAYPDLYLRKLKFGFPKLCRFFLSKSSVVLKFRT